MSPAPETAVASISKAPSAAARVANWYEPKDLDQAMRLAGYVANSGLAPKGYEGKPGNVLVAMLMGAELGLGALSSLQNIAVINGRPSLWGDAMLAVCMGHPQWEGYEEEPATEQNKRTATCSVKRKGMKPVVRTFSMADAETASLKGKQGPWTQYPSRMLQLRARAFALRDAFADALRGISSAEESQDLVEVEATVTRSEPTAKAAQPAPSSRVDALAQALAGGAEESPLVFGDEPEPAATEAAKDVDPAEALPVLKAMLMGNGTPESKALAGEVNGLARAALAAAGVKKPVDLPRTALSRLYADACAARDRIMAPAQNGGAA